MGMFDYVNYEMKCPTCGRLLNEFQTKNRNCVMARLEIADVLNFYSFCLHCHTRVEFTRKPACGVDDFTMAVEVEGINTWTERLTRRPLNSSLKAGR